jgi:hypothetical protein
MLESVCARREFFAFIGLVVERANHGKTEVENAARLVNK